MAALTQQIGILTRAEATELANTLKAQQDQHVIAYLRGFALDSASIPGLGPSFKSRLKFAGVHTAADIDAGVRRVKGIGVSRAASLIAWRRSIESKAQTTMIRVLSQTDAETISRKYRNQRLPLEDEKNRTERRQRDEENVVRAKYQRFLGQLDTEASEVNAKAKKDIQEIRGRCSQQYESFRQSLSKLADESASILREMDSKTSEIRKTLFSLHWSIEKEKRQLARFERITFSSYLKRVFIGLRAI